jgi:hypothetical protein
MELVVINAFFEYQRAKKMKIKGSERANKFTIVTH